MSRPNYKSIYMDILTLRSPEKMHSCEKILLKEPLTSMDIIEINKRIFGTEDYYQTNQKHKFYDKSDILKILDYQKKNKMNNTQLANHFKMSRNTIAKWKKKLQI